MMLSE